MAELRGKGLRREEAADAAAEAFRGYAPRIVLWLFASVLVGVAIMGTVAALTAAEHAAILAARV